MLRAAIFEQYGGKPATHPGRGPLDQEQLSTKRRLTPPLRAIVSPHSRGGWRHLIIAHPVLPQD